MSEWRPILGTVSGAVGQYSILRHTCTTNQQDLCSYMILVHSLTCTMLQTRTVTLRTSILRADMTLMYTGQSMQQAEG